MNSGIAGLRVLHTEWSASFGGQHIRTLTEMQEMEARGLKSYLACRQGSLIAGEARRRGLRVYEMPFRGSVDFVTLYQLYRLIRAEKIDIVNSHSGNDMWLATIAAKLAGAKALRTQHHPKGYKRRRSHYIYRKVDHVIATGENVRKQLIEDFGLAPDRVSAIPTGQDETRFDKSRFDRAREREKLGIPPDFFAVGMLGYLSKRKGTDEFIEAAEQLGRRHPRMVFLIAGGGNYLAEVQAMVRDRRLEERVRVLGHLDNPEHFLAALDLFVMISHEESGPQTLMQAMMMELPVVATTVGSVPDLLDDNMLIVEIGDVAGIMNAIERCAADPELCRRMASRARKPAVEKFGQALVFQRLEQLYEKLCSR